MSFVYIMESEGKYKIGVSSNPSQRANSLQVGNPYLINVVGQIKLRDIDEAKQFEKKIHQAFKDKKVRGEWYDLKEKDIIFIKNIKQAIEPKKLPEKKEDTNLRKASRLEFLVKKGFSKKVINFIKENAKKIEDEWICVMHSEVIQKELKINAKHISSIMYKLKNEGWFEVVDVSNGGVRVLKINPEIYGLAASNTPISSKDLPGPSYKQYYLMRRSRRALLDYIKEKIYYDDFFKEFIAEISMGEAIMATKLSKTATTTALHRLKNNGWFETLSYNVSKEGGRIIKIDPKLLFSEEEIPTLTRT